MAKSTVVAFALPSEFSSDPLTAVIRAGAKELLRTAVQAEVSTFMADYAHLMDEDGRQRLVRHGFLPERDVMTGIGTVPSQVPSASMISLTSVVLPRCVLSRELTFGM